MDVLKIAFQSIEAVQMAAKLIERLGPVAAQAWFAAKAETADPVTVEDIDLALQNHKTIDELRAESGIDLEEK